MMKLTVENGMVVCIAELKNRFGVYLDNDSLIRLAKRDLSRRERFVKALQRGGTLLFSMTNAAEVAGPKGSSANAVRAFLDSIGPYWIPLHMDPWTVVEREKADILFQTPVPEWFMESYVRERMSQGDKKVVDLSSEAFFRLSAVMDWVQGDWNEIKKEADRMDLELKEWISQRRVEYEKDPAFLDRMWPPVYFDVSRPATFVMNHLLRMLIVEAKAYQFKDHDARDFCHAVLAASYGSIATLDKQWKRRVENLPKPNHLAKMYYSEEIDQLVDMLEMLVNRKMVPTKN